MTCVNPLTIYVYEEGLTRFATSKFTPLGKSGSKYTHLTNYSINKKNANFIQNNTEENDSQTSSKWSLSALWKYLKEHDVDPNMIKRQIDDIAIKAIISVENQINTACQ